jgi:hypothetical protein
MLTIAILSFFSLAFGGEKMINGKKLIGFHEYI